MWSAAWMRRRKSTSASSWESSAAWKPCPFLLKPRPMSFPQSQDVRAWKPGQLQHAVCSLKRHFAALFDFELKDVDGAAFLALNTADSFLSRGVDVPSRRVWLAQLPVAFAAQQKRFDDTNHAATSVAAALSGALEKKLDEIKASADAARDEAKEGKEAALAGKTEAAAGRQAAERAAEYVLLFAL